MFFRLITFLSTAFLDISFGLVIGISFSILTIVLRGCVAKGYTLRTPKNSGVYVSTIQYQNFPNFENIMAFKYESSLYFTTVSHFKEELQRAWQHFLQSKIKTDSGTMQIELNLPNEHLNDSHIETTSTESSISNNMQEPNGIISHSEGCNHKEKQQLNAIILDCSAINYIDVMGLDVIKQIREDFEILGVDFVLACCSRSMLKKLTDKGLYGSEESKLNVFVTVHDAVLACSTRPKDNQAKGNSVLLDNEFYDIKL